MSAYLPRHLGAVLRERLTQFPIVAVTGVRQAGKTTLVRHDLPDWAYVNLEALDIRAFAQEDPRGFLAAHPAPLVIDEFQRAPALVSYLQGVVDDRGAVGQYVLTGSQSYELHEQLTQSLPGRVGLLTLLPFAWDELPPERRAEDLDARLVAGSFPAPIVRPVPPPVWYESFVSLYVERDVRQLVAVRDLGRFQTFLRLLASRAGQLLNLSALAADVGVSQPTVRSWVTVLEAGHVLRRLAPWFDNARKRLVRTPKLYFADTGLLCYLNDIGSAEDLRGHTLRGAVFENWVHGEVRKASLHRGREPSLWFWRDLRGREIDLLLRRRGRLLPVEVKAGATVRSAFFDVLREWQRDYEVSGGWVVYGGDAPQPREDVRVVPWRELTARLVDELGP
jgi:hypothetical protein